jgi:hypothetical protein
MCSSAASSWLWQAPAEHVLLDARIAEESSGERVSSTSQSHDTSLRTREIDERSVRLESRTRCRKGAKSQMKSPGVQLCRGSGRGSDTLYAGTQCWVV